MAEIGRAEVQCMNPKCKAWGPSPIGFEDEGSFHSSTLTGNTYQCHACGARTPCNKENMRWARSDGKGGWRGSDTQ